MANKTKEEIYDTQIAPLVSKIIDICKEHEIPLILSAEYAPGRLCTTFLGQYKNCPELDHAYKCLYLGHKSVTPNTGLKVLAAIFDEKREAQG